MAKKVQVNGSLAAGTNNIGDVDIASASFEGTPGSAVPTKAVLIGGTDGTNMAVPRVVSAGEGISGIGMCTTTFLHRYNGASWDRVRNNQSGILLASAARTATISSPDQTNYNGRGAHVILAVTAASDSPSIVLKIEGKDAAGNYYTLLEGAAVTGTSTNIYKVMPWIAAVANVSAPDLVPRTWRVTVTHGDTDSITYGVYYALDN